MYTSAQTTSFIKKIPALMAVVLFLSVEAVYTNVNLLLYVFVFISLAVVLASYFYFKHLSIDKRRIKFLVSDILRGSVFLIFPILGYILFIGLEEAIFHIFTLFLGVVAYWYFNFLNLLVEKDGKKIDSYVYKNFFAVINLFFAVAFSYNLFSFLKFPVWIVLGVFFVLVVFYPWSYKIKIYDGNNLSIVTDGRFYKIDIWHSSKDIHFIKLFYIIVSLQVFVSFLFLPFSALSVAGFVSVIAYLSAYVLYADLIGFLNKKLLKLYIGICLMFIFAFLFFIF